ncbi:hypothetical protein cyc_05918 [Cyclospora cayetanensis]|uniref:Uncharacterized protein n=1 Tax=Cyclospora cayetanensis TaxID=88456 RepID=A0A1D3CWP4_9EIME|nr:hypothetical protein cyc_05918 [Cyclospora cayetanensis]
MESDASPIGGGLSGARACRTMVSALPDCSASWRPSAPTVKIPPTREVQTRLRPPHETSEQLNAPPATQQQTTGLVLMSPSGGQLRWVRDNNAVQDGITMCKLRVIRIDKKRDQSP